MKSKFKNVLNCMLIITFILFCIPSPSLIAEEPLKLAVGTGRVPFMEKQMEKFKDETGYDVEIIEIMEGSDMYTKITMMMQSEQTAPDVFTEDGFMIHSDAAAGYLEPLDDFVAENLDTDMFVEAVLIGGQAADGKQYGIPFSTDVQGIWYDEELFKEASIETPFEPQNWEDIINAGIKLKETFGDDPEFIPMYLFASKVYPEETSMRTFQQLFCATGGQLYDFDEEKWVVDTNNLLKVYDFVDRIFNVEELGPRPSLLTEQNFPSRIQSEFFPNAKIGMFFSGSWESGSWKDTGLYPWPEGEDRVKLATLPTYDGEEPGYSTVSGGWTWAIPSKSQNKDRAYELLKFLSSKEVMLEYSLFSGDLSPRIDVAQVEEYQNQPMVPVEQAHNMMEYTHFRPSVEGYASVTTLYTELIENIVLGGETPEMAVDMMVSELNRIVGEDNVLVLD